MIMSTVALWAVLAVGFLVLEACTVAMVSLWFAIGAAAALVLTAERKWDRRMVGSLLVYWLFLLSWLPITLGSFWKKTTVWEEIRHTRNVAPEGFARERAAAR